MRRLFAPLLFSFLLLAACDSSSEDGTYTVQLGARPQAATNATVQAVTEPGDTTVVVGPGETITVAAGDTVRLKACIPPSCEVGSLPFRNNFSHWGGDLDERTENPTTVRVTEDMEIFGVFAVAKEYNISTALLAGDTLDAGVEQTLDIQATIETYQGEIKTPDQIAIMENAPSSEDKVFNDTRDTTYTWVPDEAGKQCVQTHVWWGVNAHAAVDSFYVRPVGNEEKVCRRH